MTRCERCDMPRATAEDWLGHEPGCACERCVAICWDDATCEPVDWRARLQAVRALLSEAFVMSSVPCVIDRTVTLEGVEYRLDAANINPLLNVWSRCMDSDMRATVGDPITVLMLNSRALKSAVARVKA